MFAWIERIRYSRGARERAVAATFVLLTVTLFLAGLWVFAAKSRPMPGASLWQALLSDRFTLGLMRMLIAVLALYVLASIVVLALRGRWMRAISTSGLEAETASDAEDAIASLEGEVESLRKDSDELFRMLWRRGRG